MFVKNFTTKLTIFLSILTLSVTMLFALQSSVNAQAYRGLIIDEIKFDLGYQDRGVQITKKFNVIHDFQEKDKKVTLYFRALDFTSDGESGTPVFLPEGTLSPEASLAKWITFEKTSITLEQYGQKEEIVFTISVPEGAEPGGKYAAILLSDQEGGTVVNNNNDSTELGMSKELGPLVFMITDGEIIRNVSADALYTTDIKGKKTQYFFNLPVNINAILRNAGNVHVQPNGAIYVYRGENFQEFITKFELNSQKGYVLPNSTRIFSFEWNDGFMYDELVKNESTGKTEVKTKVNWDKLSKFRIGKYNVKMLFAAQGGETGETYTVQKDTFFWVIPWPLIILIISIIVLTGLFITYKQVTKTKSKKNQSKNRFDE